MIPLIRSGGSLESAVSQQASTSTVDELSNQINALQLTTQAPPNLLDLPIANPDARISMFSGDQNFAVNPFKNIKKLTHLFCENDAMHRNVPRKANFTYRQGMKPASYALSLIIKDHFFAQQLIPNEQRKAALYHWVLAMLGWETHFISLVANCIQAVDESARFIDKEYTLESTEAFAFYVRFMNFLGTTKTYQIDVQRFLQKTKAVPNGTHSMQMLRHHSRIFACITSILQAQCEMETTFGVDQMSIILKRITPLLGFVVSESIGHFQSIEWLPGKITTAHGLDGSWLARIKQLLIDYHSPYFTDQMMIYETVSRSLDALLSTHAFLTKPPFNFRKWTGMEGIAVPSIADFQRDTAELMRFFAPKQVAGPVVKPFSQEELDSLAQEESVKKGKTKRHEKNQPPKAINKPESKPKTITHLEEPIGPAISPIITALMQATHLRCHKRVLRWVRLTDNELEKARQFVDYRDNKQVLLYQDMSLEAIKEQMLFHGLCPTIDKVITHLELQKKYALKTSTGYSLIVEIIRENVPSLRGVLSYALHKGFCYHRMFEVRSGQEFLRQPINELAKARLLDANVHELQMDAEEELKQELLSGFEGDTFDIDPLSEIISFLDRKNGCKIHVFPLNY